MFGASTSGLSPRTLPRPSDGADPRFPRAVADEHALELAGQRWVSSCISVVPVLTFEMHFRQALASSTRAGTSPALQRWSSPGAYLPDPAACGSARLTCLLSARSLAVVFIAFSYEALRYRIAVYDRQVAASLLQTRQRPDGSTSGRSSPAIESFPIGGV